MPLDDTMPAPPVPNLTSTPATAEPPWRIPETGPVLALDYVPTAAAQVRALWLHLRLTVPFIAVAAVAVPALVLTLLPPARSVGTDTRAFLLGSALLGALIGTIVALGLPLTLTFLAARVQERGGKKRKVRLDRDGVLSVWPGGPQTRLRWADVSSIREHGRDVVFRRPLLRGAGGVHVHGCAFPTEDAARRFRDAAVQLREGRGAEVPEGTLREFAPRQ